jgi:hypothetical protein
MDGSRLLCLQSSKLTSDPGDHFGLSFIPWTMEEKKKKLFLASHGEIFVVNGCRFFAK